MSRVIANRYVLLKHIGSGGMADVYFANDTVLNREVAIKILRGELTSDPVSILRFKQEACASSSLIHPNIVEIYDVGQDQDKSFIVMEYVKGKTLKQLINDRGALLKEEAVHIIKQLTNALIEAHRNGVIHRDIKPQNVLVKDDGTIKVVDFGIALANDALQLTQTDSIMGSVHYLAPELARGENATAQSDLYALGIVFYELLTGKVPFSGEQAVSVAISHMQNEMPSVRDINPTVPQSIDNIIQKACAKNRLHRYANGYELLQDLNSCFDSKRANEAKYKHQAPEENYTKVISKLADSKSVEPPIKKASVHKKKEKSYAGYVMISLASVVVVLICVFLLYVSGVIGKQNKTVKVPNILNLTVEQASEVLLESGLDLDRQNIKRILTNDVEKGLIIEVTPDVDTSVNKGSRITIVVSSGIYSVMNDYTHQNIDEAIKDVTTRYPNVRVISVPMENNEVKAGTIIAQELLLPNEKFDGNKISEMRFVYASYKTFVIPFNIVGMDVIQAKELLESMGAEVVLSQLDTSEMTQDQIDNLKVNVVIETLPVSGVAYTQSEGNTITLYYY